MNNRNSFSFNGRLTKDAVIKTVGDKNICTMCVAINRSFKRQDGSFQNDVTYLDIECWIRNTAYYAENFKKGVFVDVQGELRQKRWEKDGQSYSKLYISPTKPIEVLDVVSTKKADGVADELPAEDEPAMDAPLDDVGGCPF